MSMFGEFFEILQKSSRFGKKAQDLAGKLKIQQKSSRLNKSLNFTKDVKAQ